MKKRKLKSEKSYYLLDFLHAKKYITIERGNMKKVEKSIKYPEGELCIGCKYEKECMEREECVNPEAGKGE